MFEWWESLGTAGHIFACFAIPSTVVLFLQTLLMLIGIGGASLGGEDGDGADSADGDADCGADLESDVESEAELDGGLRLFSIRGMLSFLTVTGWVGVLGVEMEWTLPITILVAVVSGLAAMFMIALLFRLVFSLQADGTEDIRHALGVSGSVYLRIPPMRKGCGKVSLLLDGRLVEKDAVTDEAETLNYGEQIVVIGISGGTELIVKRKIDDIRRNYL